MRQRLMGLLILAAACGDSTAPRTIAIDGLAAELAQLEQAVASAAALRELGVLAPSFPPLGDPSGAAVLAPALLGTTFRWNADSGGYVADSGTAAVIRLELYEADSATNTPVPGAMVVGYVDFSELPPPDTGVAVSVVLPNGDTAAAYVLRDHGSANVNVEAAGRVATPPGQTAFRFNRHEGSEYGLVGEMLTAAGALLKLQRISPGDGSDTWLIRFASGLAEIELNFFVIGASASGTVRYNRATVAGLSRQGAAAPAFTPRGGFVLSASQQDDIGAIMRDGLSLATRIDPMLFGPAAAVFTPAGSRLRSERPLPCASFRACVSSPSSPRPPRPSRP